MTHPATETHWDTIVIGTGMGGATLGRALAEAGQSVLFLEQGGAGYRAEENGLSETPLPEARLARGLWPEPLHVALNGRTQTLFAPLGAGVGGSSVFYAATLERPAPHDLDPGPDHPTGGWPVSFAEMRPWYDVAARLYEVYGAPDPLSDDPPAALASPPALTPTEASLMRSLSEAGLHPYHAHTALRRLPGCAACLGRKCPRDCKRDARSVGVEPALATGRATLVTGAQVTRLLADAERVIGVDARVDGQPVQFRADRYVLAGGALGSPRVLLASASADWPNGLANRSGLVGRNLMFHLNEMFALWPKDRVPDDGATKAISFRDLYHRDGQRFGTVQSMGIRASYGEIVHYLNRMLAQSRMPGLPGLQPFTRVPAALAARLFGQAQIFVGLLEDLPYADNRVIHDPTQPDRLAVSYTIHPELAARRRAFRHAIRRALKGHRRVFLSLLPELNYGHPCGTVRFGDDPARSVLRPDCRAHDVANLWVVDAAFMPTSMGVNPSLTIAANALRVAETLTGGAR
ncbi:GMC oxidoreductase [Cognatishimia sp. F0-27]|uniref:GMC oxidoreductase n=1 Tax=Cognatishimia sp. F0-27 TaxID=2816855 RepID=UPI001D0C8560|nr:GMC family oxidoreductase [Cognatishimia sp. F0-27]MCC1491379.1 GMC family oxidoreductase [Cognatishimia sp. F0-27]